MKLGLFNKTKKYLTAILKLYCIITTQVTNYRKANWKYWYNLSLIAHIRQTQTLKIIYTWFVCTVLILIATFLMFIYHKPIEICNVTITLNNGFFQQYKFLKITSISCISTLIKFLINSNIYEKNMSTAETSTLPTI